MKKLIFIVISMAILFNACTEKKQKLNYPQTKKVDTVDIYFGKTVEDPYRWLEDDNSEETMEWVKQQNAVTNAYLEKIPFRNQIKEKLLKIWDYPKESAPSKKGDRYFFYRNNGLQNQSVLYYKNELHGEAIELLDPNTLSEKGTAALANVSISDDGKLLGYSISMAGSDWQEIFVRNIETKEDLADNLKWVKFSGISWYQDGFFYNRYQEPKKGNEFSAENKNCKVYYHKIGTTQEEDLLIYENPQDPDMGFSAAVSESKNLLFIYPSKATSGNAMYIKDIKSNKKTETKIVENFEKDFSVVYDEGDFLYVYTNYNAPKYKLIKIDIKNYNSENWEDIIAEGESVLKGISFINGKFIANYLKDAKSEIKIYNKEGNFLYNLDNELIGTISGFGGDKDDTTVFYTFVSFTEPATIYMYDVNENKSTLYKKTELKINTDNYVTDQIFYTSKDGTKIPMFIVHKKGIRLDGTNPTILWGYGGFNITYTPSFSVSRMMWLEEGGIFVLAGIRGGGEYGKDWHKAGTLMQKQNVFDDFIAAAEYLIDKKYTSPKRLAIQGGSNGGLLVGAVANQRPDLFAVAIPQVGVMDMLRYHLFTIGRYWATDYGTSSDSPEMFEYLYNYSPIHNIKENLNYPATIVTTADHDDRVVPAHSFKYIAVLQEKYKGTNPVLIRIETEAGHGAGKPTMKSIEELTDIYSFIFYNMNFVPMQKFPNKE